MDSRPFGADEHGQRICATTESHQTPRTPDRNTDAEHISYYYVIDEEGNSMRDGLMTLKGSISNHSVRISPLRTAVYSGTYNLSANYAKGWLNGPLRLTSQITIRMNGQTQSHNYTASANFSKGIPHGALTFNYKGTITVRGTANYNKGNLVGDFSCIGLDENGLPIEAKGSLTRPEN